MNPNKLAQVFHFDLYGKREAKYDFLTQNSLKSIDWNNLAPEEPNFFLVKKEFDESGMYEKGFKMDELFIKYNNGIETGKDSFFYSQNQVELVSKLQKAFDNKEKSIREFEITNTDSFKFKDKFNSSSFDKTHIKFTQYRPFDTISNYYDRNLQRRPAFDIMRNMFHQNFGLLVPRQVIDEFRHVFISKNITDCNLTATAKKFGSGPLFPLYLYPESSNDLFAKTERTPNLNQAIIDKMAEGLGIPFVAEKNQKSTIENPQSFAPIDVLDYIYAVLHSPAYREKYKEFLKIDFPKVPYPKDLTTFWKLVKLGGEIRQIHLLESPVVEQYITQYPEDGDNVVGKIRSVEALHATSLRVYINETQYFDNVPHIAWNFYIGGYQPAQKWLKDRKDRELSFEDILHYQKIIVALTETGRFMKEIDLVGVG